MVGKKGQKKRMTCAQTLTPGVSVAQVARRHSMNANLIFRWLKHPRFAPVQGGYSPEERVAFEGIFFRRD